MVIVKFKDGKYAVRKFSITGLCYEYKDLKDTYWWSRGSNFFSHCKGSLEDAHTTMDLVSDIGIPIT